MSKRKNISQEFIDDSDDSGDNGVKSKSKKKAKSELGIGASLLSKKTTSSTTSDIVEDELIPLAPKRFCNVRSFKGRVMVDIREYYQDDSNSLKPGKKGISLSLDQWNKLKAAIDTIDERIDNLS